MKLMACQPGIFRIGRPMFDAISFARLVPVSASCGVGGVPNTDSDTVRVSANAKYLTGLTPSKTSFGETCPPENCQS